jgi:hypothetical protein
MSNIAHFYPVGNHIPKSEHKASVLLPPAGAFSDQNFQLIPKGTYRVSYWIAYTRGDAAGYPVFRHEYANTVGVDGLPPASFEGNVAREIVIDPTTLTPALATDAAVKFYCEELDGPTPYLGETQYYCLTYERLPAACVGVRLRVAEKGNTASPGTCSIYFTADVLEA